MVTLCTFSELICGTRCGPILRTRNVTSSPASAGCSACWSRLRALQPQRVSGHDGHEADPRRTAERAFADRAGALGHECAPSAHSADRCGDGYGDPAD